MSTPITLGQLADALVKLKESGIVKPDEPVRITHGNQILEISRVWVTNGQVFLWWKDPE